MRSKIARLSTKSPSEFWFCLCVPPPAARRRRKAAPLSRPSRPTDRLSLIPLLLRLPPSLPLTLSIVVHLSGLAVRCGNLACFLNLSSVSLSRHLCHGNRVPTNENCRNEIGFLRPAHTNLGSDYMRFVRRNAIRASDSIHACLSLTKAISAQFPLRYLTRELTVFEWRNFPYPKRELKRGLKMGVTRSRLKSNIKRSNFIARALDA